MLDESKTYFFIDESGDPAFYAFGNRSIVGTAGFKPILLIGMVELEDKQAIRKSIIKFMEDLKNDPLYNTLPCINNSKGWYLHASYDNLEVQIKFIDFLRQLKGFKFYSVIGRKRLDLFHKKHNRNESEFYFDIIYHLLQGRLNKDKTFYQIFLAQRTKSSQQKLKQSIDSALVSDNNNRKLPIKVNYNCEVVLSKDTPELSIADYMLWSLQRYILKGEKRFYKALEEKYDQIIDLYDFDKNNDKDKSNYYDKKNKFAIEKAGEFKTNGYV